MGFPIEEIRHGIMLMIWLPRRGPERIWGECLVLCWIIKQNSQSESGTWAQMLKAQQAFGGWVFGSGRKKGRTFGLVFGDARKEEMCLPFGRSSQGKLVFGRKWLAFTRRSCVRCIPVYQSLIVPCYPLWLICDVCQALMKKEDMRYYLWSIWWEGKERSGTSRRKSWD